MSVEILYFADLKEITGNEKETFNLTALNLRSLLELLFKKYPSIKEIIWDEKSNTLKNKISIAINDKLIKRDDESSTLLSDGDRLALLLSVSGG